MPISTKYWTKESMQSSSLLPFKKRRADGLSLIINWGDMRTLDLASLPLERTTLRTDAADGLFSNLHILQDNLDLQNRLCYAISSSLWEVCFPCKIPISRCHTKQLLPKWNAVINFSIDLILVMNNYDKKKILENEIKYCIVFYNNFKWGYTCIF